MSGPTASLPSVKYGEAELKIPVYDALKSAVEEWGDGQLSPGDFTQPLSLTLDLLGVVVNPVKAIVSAPLEFLMDIVVEHVSFVREPFDGLLGKPDEIKKVAAEWGKAGDQLEEHVQAFCKSAQNMPNWTGQAADRYCRDVDLIKSSCQSAKYAAKFGGAVVGAAGEAVAISKETIWGMVKDFVSEVVAAALGALASSFVTFGGSLAGFGVWLSGRVYVILGKISSKLAKLLKRIGELVSKMETLSQKLQNWSKKLEQVADKFGHSAGKKLYPPNTFVKKSAIRGGVDDWTYSSERMMKKHAPEVDSMKKFEKRADRADKMYDAAVDGWQGKAPDKDE